VKAIAIAVGLAVGLALPLVASSAWAEPVRILVAAGSQRGHAAERVLKFSSADARRVRDVMVSQGGVKQSDAALLVEPTRPEFFAALTKARALASAHRPAEVTFVFYFSGHGDRDAIHLGDERVSIGELEEAVRSVPAALRIVVTDACRATRDKGFAPEAPFPISVTTIAQATGSVWIHASGDGEAAQESDELEGALFTHSWLNGLRGAADANGDARVTLEESFAFASSQTMIRSEKSSGVLQKPEAVINLREAAPVVLTSTSRATSAVSLPQAKDAHFLVYTRGSKSVVAELWGAADRRIALAVPAGSYVVQRRSGSTGGAAVVEIGDGETRAIEERDFVPAPLEMLASKGGDIDRGARHEVSIGYDVGSNSRSGLVQGPRLGYAFVASPYLAVAGAVTVEFAGTDPTTQERLRSAFGKLALEPRLPLGRLTLRAGLGGRAGTVVQSLGTSAPNTATTTNTAFAYGPEATLGVRMRTSRGEHGAFVDVAGAGSALFFQQSGATESMIGGAVLTTLGATF
jgi:hypothetical protein